MFTNECRCTGDDILHYNEATELLEKFARPSKARVTSFI